MIRRLARAAVLLLAGAGTAALAVSGYLGAPFTWTWLGAGLGVSVAAGWRARRWLLGPLAAPVTAWLLAMAGGGIFFLLPTSAETGARELAPGAELVYDAAGSDVVFAVEGCAGDVYVGLRDRPGGVLRLDANGTELARFWGLADVSDAAVVDCTRGRVYLADTGFTYPGDAPAPRGGALLWSLPLDLDERGAVSIAAGPGPRRLIADGDRLLVLSESGAGQPWPLAVVDLDAFEVTAELPGFGGAFVAPVPGGLVAAETRSIDVYSPDLRHLERWPRRCGWLGDTRGQVVADERRIVVVCAALGRVYAIDHQGRELARAWVGRGVRFGALVGERTAVANYTSGELLVLGPGLEVERRVRVGRRARWVSAARDGRSVLVASGAGVVRVGVERGGEW